MDIIESLGGLVSVLETGGGYAGWALFIILWWRADKRLMQAKNDLKDISLAKLENDIKTEQTLLANAQALDAIATKLDVLGTKYDSIKTALEKILLLKSSRVQVGE